MVSRWSVERRSACCARAHQTLTLLERGARGQWAGAAGRAWVEPPALLGRVSRRARPPGAPLSALLLPCTPNPFFFVCSHCAAPCDYGRHSKLLLVVRGIHSDGVLQRANTSGQISTRTFYCAKVVRARACAFGRRPLAYARRGEMCQSKTSAAYSMRVLRNCDWIYLKVQ